MLTIGLRNSGNRLRDLDLGTGITPFTARMRVVFVPPVSLKYPVVWVTERAARAAAHADEQEQGRANRLFGRRGRGRTAGPHDPRRTYLSELRPGPARPH